MRLVIMSSFAKAQGFKTNVFGEVVVHRETPKAVLVSAKGLISDSDNCWFCNRPLTNEESRTVGVGATCAKALSIPYPMTNSEAEEWIHGYGDLVEQWLPRSIIRQPQELIIQSGPSDDPIDFQSWSKDSECKGTLSIGYRPSEHHLKYEDLICLEILCEMGMEFQNQILKLDGAKWQGGSRSDPSWHNDRKFGKDKIFTAPFNPDIASELFLICRAWNVDLAVDDNLVDLVKSRIKSAKNRDKQAQELGVPSIQTIKKLSPGQLDQVNFDDIMKTTPWNHQKAAVVFCATIMGLELPRKADHDDSW